MYKIWTHRDVGASAESVWALLTDLEQWPGWGPSVRSAELVQDKFELGARGTVTTALGPRLRFEITVYEPGSRWAWKVAGVDATDHKVQPLGDGRCRVSFGVPWVAAAYLAVAQIALRRIKSLAENSEAA